MARGRASLVGAARAAGVSAAGHRDGIAAVGVRGVRARAGGGVYRDADAGAESVSAVWVGGCRVCGCGFAGVGGEAEGVWGASVADYVAAAWGMGEGGGRGGRVRAWWTSECVVDE